MRRILIVLMLVLGLRAVPAAQAGSFIHPGMAQSREDMEVMRAHVLNGDSPWVEAFERVRQRADLDFRYTPYDYVVKGPNAKFHTGKDGEWGSRDFRSSRSVAYDCALVWFVTGDRRYADKAIEILNAWSRTLRQIDGNDAKLCVGMDGYYYLSTAEILRYTDSGWSEGDQEQFRRWVLGILYPIIRNFQPGMNGNWDAAMIGTMMCIGIYTDREDIFKRAVNHFLNGSGNAGVTKYIYPSGQCQEAVRDWGHVQMGLGFMVRLANIAWTQGIDLFSAADDRIARGYEYALRYLLDGGLDLFGINGQVGRMNRISDNLEPLYQHYKYRKGIELPYVERAVLAYTRPQSGEEFLTATRAGRKEPASLARLQELPFLSASEVGAASMVELPADYELVRPGESVQDAVDRCAGTGRWVVLDEGVHVLPATLRMPSHTRMMGKGLSTILMAAPRVTPIIENADDQLDDVHLRQFRMEGEDNVPVGDNPNLSRRRRVGGVGMQSRSAITFRSAGEGIKRIVLENLTIWHCTRSGVQITGGQDISILRCDISDNGGGAVPGNGFHHNVLLSYVRDMQVKECRLTDSLCGSGLYLTSCKVVDVDGCELARNGQYGLYLGDSESVLVRGCIVEGNDAEGIFQDTLATGCQQVKLTDNRLLLNVKDEVPRY